MLTLDPPLVRSSSRLEAYSDALFSIVATVMIVPVSHVELPEDESLYTSFIRLMLPKMALFMYTFLVISFYWSVHTRLFDVLDNVDEFTVLLNLAFMMVVTFLPFTFTLLGYHITDPLAILIFSVAFAFMATVQVVFVVYVFSAPEMVHEELRDVNLRVLHRNKILVRICPPLILAVISAIFSYLVPAVSLILLFLIIFANNIRGCFVKCYSCCVACGSPAMPEYMRQERRPLSERLIKEVVSKERIEFFSDGVFAIVATLIILDICENNIPDVDMVQKYGSLGAALHQYSTMYVAYAGTFVTVALQWYVHHTLFYYIKEANNLMLMFNQLCLMFISLSPLAFKLTSNFDKAKYEGNEAIAIQFNCVVLFLAGLSQAVIWVAALFDQERFLVPQGHHGRGDHYYVSAKLMVYPLIAFIAFWPTCFLKDIKVSVFVATQVGAIGLFIILGLLFSQIHRLSARHEEGPLLPEGDDSQEPGLGMGLQHAVGENDAPVIT